MNASTILEAAAARRRETELVLAKTKTKNEKPARNVSQMDEMQHAIETVCLANPISHDMLRELVAEHNLTASDVRKLTGPQIMKMMYPSAQAPQKVAKAKKPRPAPTPQAPTKNAAVGPKNPPSGNSVQPPTVVLATELQRAFDHFNETLFDGQLPACMLRVERLNRYLGYFRARQWNDVVGKAFDGAQSVAEIVLDPVAFRNRSMAETLSTLVHEMAHLKDFADGTAPKRAYHGKSWVAIMVAVGLKPVICDAKGVVIDKPTGPNATHEIVKGGKFDVAFKALVDTGFTLTWTAVPEPEKPGKEKKKKAGAKAKFECGDCGAAAWGKPTLKLACGECEIAMICEAAGDYEEDE